MTSSNFSFKDWRDFNAHCDEIKDNVEKELKNKAKELRHPSLDQEKIETLALSLAEEGEKKLKENIKAAYPDESNQDLIHLFMGTVSPEFNAPNRLPRNLEEIIKGEREPITDEEEFDLYDFDDFEH